MHFDFKAAIKKALNMIDSDTLPFTPRSDKTVPHSPEDDYAIMEGIKNPSTSEYFFHKAF